MTTSQPGQEARGQSAARPALPWVHVTLPPVRGVAGWQARGEQHVYLTGHKAGEAGAFVCRWPWVPVEHPPIWDMVEACRTAADVSSPDEGRRLAELFEAGEDLPELGWLQGQDPEPKPLASRRPGPGLPPAKPLQ